MFEYLKELSLGTISRFYISKLENVYDDECIFKFILAGHISKGCVIYIYLSQEEAGSRSLSKFQKAKKYLKSKYDLNAYFFVDGCDGTLGENRG